MIGIYLEVMTAKIMKELSTVKDTTEGKSEQALLTAKRVEA